MSLQSVLLAMLNDEPNTGYGIARLLRNGLRHLWDARQQQIYLELGKLQDKGLVDVRCVDLPGRPAKKVYSLSPAGRQQLDEWLAADAAAHSCKDDLLVKIYCLDRMPADLLARHIEQRLIDRERRSAELRERLAQAQNGNAAGLGEILTLEAALGRTEAQAAWCAKALGRIRGGTRVARHVPRPSSEPSAAALNASP